jgi:hypothetical protein
MRRLFIVSILCLLTMGQARPSLAPDALIITRKDCGYLIRHQPDADVAYRPGVDVNGRPVVGADLTPRLDLPQAVDIDIIVQPTHRRRQPRGALGVTGEPYIGRASVLMDGRAYFNGQPVHDEWQEALAAKCRQTLSGGH